MRICKQYASADPEYGLKSSGLFRKEQHCLIAMALNFSSRRSPVLCRRGCVAASQPLAASAGLRVLRGGGNAADAAVAVAAALNVTEPCSTGIGGDCFCLFYEAGSGAVRGLNGSGRAPRELTLDLLSGEGYSPAVPLPQRHAHNVTVPGAAAGWVDTVERFGSGQLSLAEILAPAIALAEEGFPVAPVAAHHWASGAAELQRPDNPHGQDLLMGGGAAPSPGDIIKMPHLAQTFRLLAEQGKKGFYEGRVAAAIVECVRAHGGVMSLEDLKEHRSSFDDPVKVTYRGVDVWEMPPNGQGLTALMALNILEGFNFQGVEHNSAEYLHLLIEALQLSFADTQWYCADPAHSAVPTQQLLSRDYATQRRQLIRRDRCLPAYERGSPPPSSDTVYFAVVDCHGNAASFINSNYMGFGTGLVPQGCSFTLQNRGANFSLDPAHPNCLAPGKRPYHTIIPAMATVAGTSELYACFGVMGGFMQPQGHVQVLLNMVEFGMEPQAALDAPRFCICSHASFSGPVSVEEGVVEEVLEQLRALGHDVAGPVSGHARATFGRGQVIQRRRVRGEEGEGVLWAGSDPRADGMAVGY